MDVQYSLGPLVDSRNNDLLGLLDLFFLNLLGSGNYLCNIGVSESFLNLKKLNGPLFLSTDY